MVSIEGKCAPPPPWCPLANIIGVLNEIRLILPRLEIKKARGIRLCKICPSECLLKQNFLLLLHILTYFPHWNISPSGSYLPPTTYHPPYPVSLQAFYIVKASKGPGLANKPLVSSNAQGPSLKWWSVGNLHPSILNYSDPPIIRGARYIHGKHMKCDFFCFLQFKVFSLTLSALGLLKKSCLVNAEL